MGQFIHLLRRNVPMIYIIEDNGVYGLTKGQFSATADIGSKLKTGVVNDLPAIDICALAIQMGATFVGRSFSGDKKQLSAMLKAAIAHQGTVLLDVISPCVTFNDHEGSTKSYKYMQEHEEAVARWALCRTSRTSRWSTTRTRRWMCRCMTARICGCARCMRTTIRRTRCSAVKMLMDVHEKGEVLTGVFYVDTQKPDFTALLNMVDEPLATLPQERTRPSREVLAELMEAHL